MAEEIVMYDLCLVEINRETKKPIKIKTLRTNVKVSAKQSEDDNSTVPLNDGGQYKMWFPVETAKEVKVEEIPVTAKKEK